MKPFKISDLQALSKYPNSGIIDWLVSAEDSVSYLKNNIDSDELVIYACGRCILIHGVLALTSKVTPPNGNDLHHSVFPDVEDCWTIQTSYGGVEGHRMYLEPPLSSTNSESLIGGEKLIYRRTFNGVQDGSSTIELSQKLIHSLGLHYLKERNAYCRLDPQGDIEDVIKIIQSELTDNRNKLDVVTIQRKDLDKFMALSSTSLILRFDFTRFNDRNFCGWGKINHYKRKENDLFYHGGTDNQASFANGALIIRSRITVDELVQKWQDEENPKNRQYATFKIYDRKNNRNIETSCAPESLSNYFQNSDLPWELSPAFFRPEVLARFKSDPEKFTLEDRSVSCRNAWYLRSLDINEAGQVHAYIGDLAHLPYQEQLYWQCFNEWPKASISERAHRTDMLGKWDTEYDPLNTLKNTIQKLDNSPTEWWKPRGEKLIEATRYPVTDSSKEWADEIMALDQLLIEGFLVAPLKSLVESGGHQITQNLGSLKLMQKALAVKGLSESEVIMIIDPLRRLHELRTTIRGHATGNKKKIAETEARTKYGNFRTHFIQLVTDCEKALSKILLAWSINFEK